MYKVLIVDDEIVIREGKIDSEFPAYSGYIA